MTTAIANIFQALAAILFCWVPIMFGIHDWIGGDKLSVAIPREWARWWQVYDDCK